ncbi:MAG TPA: VCBS repeat-containing protein [Planctomycetota bacterium]
MRPELKLNDGRGVFTAVPGFWPPSPGVNLYHRDPVASADFDGDGLRELLVPLVHQPFPTSTQFLEMRRLEANGDHQLIDLGAAAAPGAEIAAPGLVDDADGDGDLDVVTHQGVWQNNGAGFFTLLPQAFQNFSPVRKGDVDGDGDQDLLAVFAGVPSLAILYRTGPATYSMTVLLAPTTFIVEGSPALFADLDDDGDLDAIAKESLSSTVKRTATFLNNGAGVFTAGPTFAMSGALAAADFDGDGRTDVVVQETDRLQLLRRTGPGLVYAPAIAYALVGMNGAADLDQDGDIDLLGNTTAWNRRFVMPTAGQRRQYGQGSAGTGGRRPTLSLIGPVRGGLAPKVRMVGGLGGSIAVLFASDLEAFLPNLLPGVTAYIGPPVVSLGLSLSGAPGQPGAGAFELPIWIPPGTLGAQMFLECLVLDPAGPIGLTHSNGCEKLVGQ